MRKKKPAPSMKIIPLGGLEQIGMNITAFEYNDSIIVVDCGLAFPNDDMYGIDLVIPDISYLKENEEKVKAFFITHGHEDHIGALPYVLKELHVPVYGTKLTLGIIGIKLKEHSELENVPLEVVSYGDTVKLDDFNVEIINTNHSISDACALAITTPAGTIIHTGDFKIDFTPVLGETIDLQRLGEFGKKGVLALMCDSTNALKPGLTMSEKTVGKTFDNIFAENTGSRIIVATFASNVDRVQQIINSAAKFRRKVAMEGRSMVNIVSCAQELGYLNVPEGLLITTEEAKNYPNEQLVFIMTGSQGESMSALSRIAGHTHRKVSIIPGDVVIISSTPIPGNEKNVSKLINELIMQGAHVIFQDTHVSGHASQEEIKMIYRLTNPRYSIPVHGEYRHRIAQKELAIGLGMDKDDVLMAKSGDIIEISKDEMKIVGNAPARGVLVDGYGIGDIGNTVLKERHILSESGIVMVSIAIEAETGNIVDLPKIISKGFVYHKDSEDLMIGAEEVLEREVNRNVYADFVDLAKMKVDITGGLTDYFNQTIKRRPMIVVMIHEV